jgi:hypothetical protein
MIEELYLIQDGIIDVGYSIEDSNKSVKYCMQLENVKYIGDFCVLFDLPSKYYFKSNTTVNGFGINKDVFVQTLEKYPELYDKLRRRAFRMNKEYIHQPIQKQLNIDIKNFNSMNRVLEIVKDNLAEVY